MKRNSIYYGFIIGAIIGIVLVCIYSSNVEKTNTTLRCNDSSQMSTKSTEFEVTRDLYSIFYGTDSPFSTYSKQIKEKFKELGITSNIDYPYTPSFESEIMRMESMAQKVSVATGDLAGFDSDILFGGQGDAFDINLVLTDILIHDEDNVTIRAKYSINDYESDRVFIMKRINGTFKIDDMDDLRAFINEECENCEIYLNKNQQSQYKSI